MDKKWWTLIGVCGGTFMLLLDTTVVYVVLPPIQEDLGASFSDMQWIIDAYALALAALLLTTGTLGDRFGRRRMYSIGVGIFTLGSLLCGLAQSPLFLIASRAVQGVGGSVMFATGLALIAGSFQGKERGMAFGTWGMVTGLASAAGPVVGGLIASGITWRGIFLVNVPIGIAVGVIMILRVAEAKSPVARKLDWPGFVLFTGGLGSLIYGLIHAGETSWTGSATLALLAVGGILLIAFLITERVTRQPMFDLRLFRIPTFVGGAVAAFAMNGSLFAMFLFLAIYFQGVLEFSALETGVRFLLASLAMLVASIIAGRLSSRISPRLMIGGGLIAVGAGLVLMSGVSGSTEWTHFIPGLLIGGLGAGMVNPPLASTAVGVVDLSRSGMASGVNSTFRQIGVSSSVAVLGSILAAVIGDRFADGLRGGELAGQAGRLSDQVGAGQAAAAVGSAPAQLQSRVDELAVTGFVDGINTLLIIGAAVAFVGGVLALLLIRAKDFVPPQPPPRAKPAEESQTPIAVSD